MVVSGGIIRTLRVRVTRRTVRVACSLLRPLPNSDPPSCIALRTVRFLLKPIARSEFSQALNTRRSLLYPRTVPLFEETNNFNPPSPSENQSHHSHFTLTPSSSFLKLSFACDPDYIGIVQCQKALVNALIERWHPDTHTFHLPIGECSVILEDVALILGLPTDGLPVTGMTMSSFEAMEAECLLQFGVAPRKEDCRSSCIKLTWLRNLKENLELTDEISIQRYVRCHIMLLIGTILFGDKSGAGVHWKFLPLLRDFVNIGQFSWGSACLAHLYRALCRASRYNCKEIDGPLTLLLDWAWIRLPYISPFPREPRSFPLANRFLKLAHFRKAFDELQEGQFAWVAYAVDRVDPNIIPAEIYMQSVVWSATVPLMSFECIEWHATDRVRRQFGFVQGVPTQE
ncbi:uncharacterized protein DS421_18g611430 [Arachis hypogaea]|nr:uncharacterized protein DS421_18g611430 [Arachis hypogaea]